MITGATRGGGGRKLANHLADAKNHNVETVMGATRGLGATEIRAALRELDAGAAGGNTDRHAYHLHMDPGPAEAWTDDTRREAWARLEAEMGLADAPFVEVRHTTWRTLDPGDDLDRVRAVHGPEAMREQDGLHQVLMAHEHRVYDLTRDDGSVIDTAHDFARREKVARTFEHDHGFDLVPGRHNRAVAARLDDERPDVAAVICSAGLTDGPRPQASVSPRARAQAERTAIDPAAVAAAALAAWRASDGAEAFAAALTERGLRLAQGGKVPVIVDTSGAPHPLARLLGKESKSTGDRIGAAQVRARLTGLDLVPVDQVAALPQAAPGAAPPASPALPDTADAAPTPLPGGDHASIPDPAPAEAADVVGRPDRGLDGGHDAGRPDPGSHAVQGLSGPRSDSVRGAEDGEADGEPDGPPGPPRPAGGAGADSTRSDSPPPGSDRGGAAPDGGAAGRHRVQARRTLRGLAAAVGSRTDRLAELTAALRQPPTAAAMLAAALAASDEKAARVLAGEPWRDPRMRSTGLIAADMHEERMIASRATDLRAEVARAEAEAARGKIGILDRLAGFLGVRTAAVRDLDEAKERVARAEAACDGGPELRADLARLDGHARGVARAREAEREAWTRRPEVVAARRELDGNDLVRAAAAGDFRIACLVVADLAVAREAVLRREAERIAREDHQRREAAPWALAWQEPERLAVASRFRR